MRGLPPEESTLIVSSTWASDRVFRFSRQQVERVGNQVQHGAQGLFCAVGISREVEHNRGADSAAQSAREGGKAGMLRTFGAHQLRHSVEHARANFARRLGRDVALRDASSAGGDDEADVLRQISQRLRNCWLLIGQDALFNYFKIVFAQQAAKPRAGKVLALAAMAGVA